MSGTLAAALVAGTAAVLLGTSSVAQRRGMAATDEAPARSGLLATLVRSGWWWVGTAASVGGLALQFLALTLGSLIVVQTTLVGSIVATTLAEWLLLGRTPGRRRWAGMVLTTTGLATVLVALSPTAGSASHLPSSTELLVLGGVTLALSAGAAWRARSPAATGLALSVATGLGYGVTAIALKSVGAQLGSGATVPLGHPALWVALVVGPLSVLLSQHAFQRARAVVAAVSVIVVIDPVVGLLAGVAWFGEHVALTPTSLVAALAAAAAVVVGIVASHAGPRPPASTDDPPPWRSVLTRPTTSLDHRALVGSRSSA
jgi:drug/metabolite transporter (DMT)-like permease